MIKYTLAVIIACLCMACQHPVKQTGSQTTTQPAKTVADSTRHKVTADRLIIPGEKIGRIKINMNADTLWNIIGKPDKHDAAMGAQLMTWFTKHDSTAYQTNVYSHRNMGAKDEAISHIKAIRVTSPTFATNDGLHTGMSMDSIKKSFTPGHKNVNGVYDDIKAGIAFEADIHNNCSAIIVHARGDSLVSYLNMHP